MSRRGPVRIQLACVGRLRAPHDAAGRLYFGAADDKVYALDPGGSLLWAAPTSADVDAPLVLGPGGALYAGTDDGRLFALR